MAKRYQIFPVIGDGQSELTPFRAAVSDVGNTNTTAIIPTDQDGYPKYGFAFVYFGTSNLPACQQVSNSFTFPDFPLDAEMSAMEEQTRLAMNQSVAAYDLDGNGLHISMTYELTDSYRQVLDSIMKTFEPATSINNIDVQEPGE